MSRMTPISYREFMRRLRKLGFEGPEPGGSHDFMVRDGDQLKVNLPRKDQKDKEIRVPMQQIIMHQIGVSRKKWMSL